MSQDTATQSDSPQDSPREGMTLDEFLAENTPVGSPLADQPEPSPTAPFDLLDTAEWLNDPRR